MIKTKFGYSQFTYLQNTWLFLVIGLLTILLMSCSAQAELATLSGGASGSYYSQLSQQVSCSGNEVVGCEQ